MALRSAVEALDAVDGWPWCRDLGRCSEPDMFSVEPVDFDAKTGFKRLKHRFNFTYLEISANSHIGKSRVGYIDLNVRVATDVCDRLRQRLTGKI